MSLFPKFEAKELPAAVPATSAIQCLPNSNNSGNSSSKVAKVDNRNEITMAELWGEAGEDWVVIRKDPEMLKDFAHAVMTVRLLRRGQIPLAYKATTRCKKCGIVPIFEGYPSEVEGCPWCYTLAPIGRSVWT